MFRFKGLSIYSSNVMNHLQVIALVNIVVCLVAGIMNWAEEIPYGWMCAVCGWAAAGMNAGHDCTRY